MINRFFKLKDNCLRARGFPWASGLDAPYVEETCPACGRRFAPVYEGEAEARIDNKGSRWSDIIGSGTASPPFMISERVIDTLRGVGVESFEEHPVRITEIKSKQLRIIPPPQYYYLNVKGEMDIDREASGIPERKVICPVCLMQEPYQPGEKIPSPERLIPRPETWDGSDLFILRNYGRSSVFCTRKVLELARQHRWTNFRFEPIDVLRRYATRWKGIDYLGKKWPPKWYPDPPHHGKTLEQWLEQVRSTDGAEQYAARLALLEIGAPAIPGLTDLLRHGTDPVRREAAAILCGIARKTSLPSDLRAEVRPLLPPDVTYPGEPGPHYVSKSGPMLADFIIDESDEDEAVQ